LRKKGEWYKSKERAEIEEKEKCTKAKRKVRREEIGERKEGIKEEEEKW
jgi:hypothetical protein